MRISVRHHVVEVALECHRASGTQGATRGAHQRGPSFPGKLDPWSESRAKPRGKMLVTGGNRLPGERDRTWGAWGRRRRQASGAPGGLRLVRKKRGCLGPGSCLHPNVGVLPSAPPCCPATHHRPSRSGKRLLHFYWAAVWLLRAVGRNPRPSRASFKAKF